MAAEMHNLPLDEQQQYLYNPRVAMNEATLGASGAVFGCLAAFGYLFPNRLVYLYFFVPSRPNGLFCYMRHGVVPGNQQFRRRQCSPLGPFGRGLVGILLVMYWKTEQPRFLLNPFARYLLSVCTSLASKRFMRRFCNFIRLNFMNVMEDSYRKRMNLGQDGNALVQLIVINAVLFVILKFIYVIYLLTPARPGTLITTIFSTGLFCRPTWINCLPVPGRFSPICFPTDRVFRFIANMFWLWGFGYIFQDLTGNRKLVPVYIYGGIAGALSLSCLIIFSQATGTDSSRHAGRRQSRHHGRCHSHHYRSAGLSHFPMINGGIPLWVLTLDLYPH